MTNVVSPRLVLGARGIGSNDRPSFLSRNPARHSEVLAVVPVADNADVLRAVAAADDAQRAWRDTSPIARGDVLFAAAERVRAAAADLAELIAREVGKTISEARGEVTRGIDILRYYASVCSAPDGDLYPSRTERTLIFTTRRPLGVVAAITPWNFPLAIPLWKIAPAMAFGNTVVLKPANQAAGVAAALTDILLSAGLPPGVLNVLYGDGPTVGRLLVDQATVRAVTFTGSTAAGREVARNVAQRNGRAQTEMGGSNATIVLDDADIPAAVRILSAASMSLSGQKCTATSRVIATPGVYPALVEALVAHVEQLTVGDPVDPAVDVGPLIDAGARDAFVSAIARACSEGGRILTGGRTLTEGSLADGYFVSPTVIDQAAPQSFLNQNEVFAPVVSLIPASSAVNAIEIANNVPYGLSAAIITSDLDRALEFAERIDAGVVKVNAESTGLEPHVPFGGLKESGSPWREQGSAARLFFTEERTVYLHPSRRSDPDPHA